MNLNTHTDAKTESLSSTQKVLHAEQGISVRTLPEQWIEVEANLPGTGLETTGGIERVMTRIVLRERPRGSVIATREPSGGVRVRVPLKSNQVRDDGARATDGIGGVAADVLAHARNAAANQMHSSQQDTDFFPRRSGGVSVS